MVSHCIDRCNPQQSIMTSSATSSNLPRTNEGKRICQVVKVKPEYLEEYKKVRSDITGDGLSPKEYSSRHQVHQAVWPAILGNLKESQIVGKFLPHPLLLSRAHPRQTTPYTILNPSTS